MSEGERPAGEDFDLDVTTLAPRDAYALLTSFILPRPIALVSTVSEDGVPNVAPFSYFTGVGSDPPTVALSVGDRRDGHKDTLRNAKASGVLCINLVEEAISEAMNAASAELPPAQSEFDLAGLTPTPCSGIDCVYVAEARARLECKLVDVHVYGRKNKTNLVVAEVVHVHIDAAIAAASTFPRVDPHLAQPVGRMGGPNYAKLGERYQHRRPK